MFTFTLNDGTKVPLADFKIDTYRGGSGSGWGRTPDNGVRVTHAPTGYTAECSTERSQHKNRLTALGIVFAKLNEVRWRPAPVAAAPVEQCDLNPLPHGQL